MTRREEREKIARDYENKIIENNPNAEAYDYMNAVIYGAEWADKTMLDRVCEWLDKYMCNKSNGIKVKDYQLVGELIYNLRKAMEE